MKIYNLIFVFCTYSPSMYPLNPTTSPRPLPTLKVLGTRLFCFQFVCHTPQGSRFIGSSQSREAGGALDVSEGGRRDRGTSVPAVMVLGGKPILRTGSGRLPS